MRWQTPPLPVPGYSRARGLHMVYTPAAVYVPIPRGHCCRLGKKFKKTGSELRSQRSDPGSPSGTVRKSRRIPRLPGLIHGASRGFHPGMPFLSGPALPGSGLPAYRYTGVQDTPRRKSGPGVHLFCRRHTCPYQNHDKPVLYPLLLQFPLLPAMILPSETPDPHGDVPPIKVWPVPWEITFTPRPVRSHIPWFPILGG